MLTRRQFIFASAGTGTAFLATALLKANRTYANLAGEITKFTEPLPIPFAASPPSTLTIAKSSHSFHTNLGAGPTLAYGGFSILGPSIEVTRGTAVSINVFNNIVGNHGSCVLSVLNY
ncbi:MAG: hypothetical protein HEQ35_17450 [Gloeotrichia echinulata IR180]